MSCFISTARRCLIFTCLRQDLPFCRIGEGPKRHMVIRRHAIAIDSTLESIATSEAFFYPFQALRLIHSEAIGELELPI